MSDGTLLAMENRVRYFSYKKNKIIWYVTANYNTKLDCSKPFQSDPTQGFYKT